MRLVLEPIKPGPPAKSVSQAKVYFWPSFTEAYFWRENTFTETIASLLKVTFPFPFSDSLVFLYCSIHSPDFYAYRPILCTLIFEYSAMGTIPYIMLTTCAFVMIHLQ